MTLPTFENFDQWIQIEKILRPYIHEARVSKIECVARQRTNQIQVCFEDITNQGNVSAAWRTLEILGFLRTYQSGKILKHKCGRVSLGAEKWLLHSKVPDTMELIQSKKNEGFQIVGTHLSSTSKDFREVDFTQKTFLIFGNEKKGISEEALSYCDEKIILPQIGFGQSFNLSVAISILFSHIAYQVKPQKLSEKELQALLGIYFFRSTKKADKILSMLLNKNT